MIVLTIRTDKPEAELGLFRDGKQLEYCSWQAHRELAETIHLKLRELLDKRQMKPADIQGLIVFAGPGSFTGLRIGISVANALADGLSVPIVGETGEQWLQDGLKRLTTGGNDKLVMPEYGAPVHITTPKH